MLTTTQLAVYAPLAWITLGLNYVLGGLDPWGYHLGNMLLHAGSAVLFFHIARRLLAAGAEEEASAPGVLPGAAVAALVFAVHPLRVESVAWVTERRDVLSAFLSLAAVLAYLRGVERRGRLRAGWRIASLAAFAAALSAKGLAMTLPVSLLVLDAYPLRRHRRARLGRARARESSRSSRWPRSGPSPRCGRCPRARGGRRTASRGSARAWR